MSNQYLKEYINNYEITSNISASSFIITILKKFNEGIKINNIYKEKNELMIDFSTSGSHTTNNYTYQKEYIFIKDFYNKEEIITKIQTILRFSYTIISMTYGNNSQHNPRLFNYLTKHIKKYGKTSNSFNMSYNISHSINNPNTQNDNKLSSNLIKSEENATKL